MTFVRTKLRLERMQPGEVLSVRLRGEEPLRNVPRAAREEGHSILWIEAAGDAHIVTIRRLIIDSSDESETHDERVGRRSLAALVVGRGVRRPRKNPARA